MIMMSIVGSLIVTMKAEDKYILWWGMLIMVEAMKVWRQGVDGKSFTKAH